MAGVTDVVRHQGGQGVDRTQHSQHKASEAEVASAPASSEG